MFNAPQKPKKEELVLPSCPLVKTAARHKPLAKNSSKHQNYNHGKQFKHKMVVDTTPGHPIDRP
jgi:hypothetical protein